MNETKSTEETLLKTSKSILANLNRANSGLDDEIIFDTMTADSHLEVFDKSIKQLSEMHKCNTILNYIKTAKSDFTIDTVLGKYQDLLMELRDRRSLLFKMSLQHVSRTKLSSTLASDYYNLISASNKLIEIVERTTQSN